MTTKSTNYAHLVRKEPTGPFKPGAVVVTPPHVTVQAYPYKGPAPSLERPAFVRSGNQRGRVLQGQEGA